MNILKLVSWAFLIESLFDILINWVDSRAAILLKNQYDAESNIAYFTQLTIYPPQPSFTACKSDTRINRVRHDGNWNEKYSFKATPVLHCVCWQGCWQDVYLFWCVLRTEVIYWRGIWGAELKFVFDPADSRTWSKGKKIVTCKCLHPSFLTCLTVFIAWHCIQQTYI